MLDFFSKLKEVFVKNVPDTSEPKKLDTTDFAKLVRDALLVGGAAIVTFLSERLTTINIGELVHNVLPMFTVEQWNMLCVPAVAFVLQSALKFFKGK